MRLRSITYAEHQGTPQEWRLDDLTLGPRNLIVGKNASGKSRTLNVIHALARNLAGLTPPGISAQYDCTFDHEQNNYRYELRYEEEQVVFERFTMNGRPMLERAEGGEGSIYAEQVDKGKPMRFQTPTSQFAALARRDKIQHEYLEPLFEWASSLRHFYFGSSLGKNNYAIFVPSGGVKADERDPSAIVPLFRRAHKQFGNAFTDTLIEDLARVDYLVSEVGVQPPVSVRFQGAPGELMALYVREKDLPGITDQGGMSQGMFRVLALLVHLNYYALSKSATCVLIDDIGEGLDFDRSCRLIDLLREKALTTDTQLVFATNDRFVMNRVPLEEWSVLQRHGNHVSVRNYQNSKALFEEFKFTGLSNFSFLEMDVASEAVSRPTKH